MVLSSSQQWDLSVGSTPRVGAVATTTAGGLGHVAIVESVNGDGTVRVSEMNYEGWNIVSSRTANASSFLYIY
jgi:surface antigen